MATYSLIFIAHSKNSNLHKLLYTRKENNTIQLFTKGNNKIQSNKCKLLEFANCFLMSTYDFANRTYNIIITGLLLTLEVQGLEDQMMVEIG